MRQVAGENHAPDSMMGADMCQENTATLVRGKLLCVLYRTAI